MGCCGGKEDDRSRGGRAISGGYPSQAQDQQWRAQQQAAARRNQGNQRSSFGGQGKTLGGAGVGSESGVDARDLAAQAALSRHAGGKGGATDAAAIKVNQRLAGEAERNQKQELLGRIEAQLAMRGETRDPRLGMASVEALQKHLANMQKSP